ncbi:phycobilisome linker polypeptide [Pseudanabaena sp. FACHB-2040]|uniref:phycobilisome linker polypeptide n=1 Tax=Pseudanabaena sp. FACHB-2040 TaxID=2692859 RepID=UPI001683CF4B|nr:phycobilisome linker polypeptide [Pseudanabaena sp. FACHB-2040]MBD2258984.1 phycobilisome linker polypeptide [Pseudanabaena sp. FACHB-2040]
MLAQNAFGSTTTSPSGGRVFLYEVSGLRQNEGTDNNAYPVRNSGSVFIKVPYSRMNEEMQRITRMGGKIVSITPLSENGAGA